VLEYSLVGECGKKETVEVLGLVQKWSRLLSEVEIEGLVRSKRTKEGKVRIRQDEETVWDPDSRLSPPS
jgi:hypothetical protein